MTKIIEVEKTTPLTGESSSFLNDAVKFLPLLSIVLFVLSIFKQTLYYYYFNLDVLSFIELNEVIVEYINSLFFTLSIFIFSTAFAFLTLPILKKPAALPVRTFFKNMSSGNTTLPMVIFLTIITITHSILFINGSVQFTSIYWYREFAKVRLTQYLISVAISILILHIPFRLIGKGLVEFDKIKFYTYTILICLFGFSIGDGRNECYQTKLNSTYGTSFTLGTKIYKSTPTYYYIGKTKNYVFYFNSVNESTTAYQMKDITSLNIVKLSLAAAEDSVQNYYKRKVKNINY